MKWNQFFSHNTRRREGAADSLLRLLAPSLLGMAVCMLTLCSLTWAWFNMSIDTNIGTIQSASVEVCVSNDATFNSDVKFISGSDTLTVPFSANSTSQSAILADNETSTGTQNALYFIVRSNVSDNCKVYLKVGNTYYGPLKPVKPDTGGSYPTVNYPVYSIDLSETTTTTTVSIHWGSLPESTTATELFPIDTTASWSTGNASVQTAGEWGIFVGRPSSETSEDENQNETEMPANDDTINDDAKTPDDTTTGDAVKDPSGVTGDTPTGTGAGDSGTAGTGESSGTGSDATDGDSGTGGSETGGDADNATNSVSGDAIPAGGSV